MSFTSNVIIMLWFAQMASNSGVLRFSDKAQSGSPIYHIYLEDRIQCFRACYDESECAVAQYDETNGQCRLFRPYGQGTVDPKRTISGYVFSREETDLSCVTELETADIPFQKIPRREDVAEVKCKMTQDVTVIQPYDRSDHCRFFVSASAKIAANWNATKFRLIFSRKAEKTCTSVPVFHKANLHRLFFGEIYNATGYYFYNAYAFTDYCVSPKGECLGVQKIQEYVDEKGNFFYDEPGLSMTDSGLGQTFFIVGKIYNV